MREKLVTDLVKEVLGPRGGPREILYYSSPLNEYITGVLAPITEELTADIDSSAELPVEDTGTYEGETEDVDVSVPPFFYPALDPKRRPSTFGLSFVVEAEGIPEASVCLTWARYFFFKDEAGRPAWKRQPRYAIFPVRFDSSHVLWIDEKGRRVESERQAEISFHVMVKPLQERRYLVNLYFVNRIKPPENGNPTAEHHIFQPQIRVVLHKGTKLAQRTRKSVSGSEEQKLEFLYRRRPVLARGHLCSAVWKEIDPENEPPNVSIDFPECRNDPPFAWPDGILLPDAERKKFSPPHVRTEFVPAYSIPFPELEWPNKYGEPPELNAAILAEIWDPESLRKALTPICIGYERWIHNMEKQLESLSQEDREIAYELIEECRIALRRMARGIDVLCSDRDARLAFCFANKAIDLQWKWRKNTDFVWRPFQLAFVLLTVDSIVNPQSEDRNICDLLWVPTGAGKTEAYLAVVAFTIALRRRRALTKKRGDLTGAGVAVITRYTLRLLTIQQFRRMLSLIAACEYLRVYNLMRQGQPVGWRPSSCKLKDDFLWGSTPFSIGLWVGGKLSPNRLSDTWSGNTILRGALSILKGGEGEGEPAQVLNCPACSAILAVPEMGLQAGKHTLHFVVRCHDGKSLAKAISHIAGREFHRIIIREADIFPHSSTGYYTLTLKIDAKTALVSRVVDEFWHSLKEYLQQNHGCVVNLVPVRASRLGYFTRYYIGRGGSKIEYDFEIFCPNPSCPLRVPWIGGLPSGWIHGREPSLTPSSDGLRIPPFRDGNRMIEVQDQFTYCKEGYVSRYVSDRIPIPALTVDEQIYRRLPTVLVATVDKFARPPFEPHAGAIFGNVDYHHCIYGYYRLYQPACQRVHTSGHPLPMGAGRRQNYVSLSEKPDPPELIIQDELHLIEGPLGSLAGIYEAAVDHLCSENGNKPKYIASTATIRRAEEQVRAVFLREVHLFPPHGLDADDRFFIREREMHVLEDGPAGRLYVGICAPGRGALTPLVRIYARLLQTVWQLRNHPDIDLFWTLTGYFNAVRELAGARALYRQDIPQRVNQISGGDPRPLTEERSVELSSRTPSTDLPAKIDLLNRRYPDAPDVLFTTSMFGTGVDIQRIGLMVVNGQPKTTSAYIQSTGRVGRSKGALVVTFFRATRPRDLSHYEFFIGYHRQLHRFVEPPTVYPFSTGVLDRALGPVMVFLLRNMRSVSIPWYKDDSAPLMQVHRRAPEVSNLPHIMERRAQGQPPHRLPAGTTVIQYSNSELEKWQLTAARNPNLKYVEYAITTQPRYPVVLGDYQHQHAGLDVVYENAPHSLRDIEETTGFET